MTRRSPGNLLFYGVLRQVARVLFSAFFCVRCVGRANWPAEGAVLVCANHQSFLDPVLVGLTCDRRMNYLARQTLNRFGPSRWLLETLDTIWIDRDGIGVGGIKETMRRLRRGEIVLMFPEGTRTRTGELGQLKSGICAVARRADAPIIPLGIDGAFQAWPRGRYLPRPGTIHMTVGRPISAKQIQQWSDEQLVEALAQRMRQCLADAQTSRQRSRRSARFVASISTGPGR